MTQTAQTSKQVHILGKATFKTSGYVLYRVQAEVGGIRHEPHNVTVVDGKITGCSECKAWEYKHTCCHTERVMQAEAEHQAAIALKQSILNEDLVPHVQDDLSVKGTLNNSNKGFSLLR